MMLEPPQSGASKGKRTTGCTPGSGSSAARVRIAGCGSVADLKTLLDKSNAFVSDGWTSLTFLHKQFLEAYNNSALGTLTGQTITFDDSEPLHALSTDVMGDGAPAAARRSSGRDPAASVVDSSAPVISGLPLPSLVLELPQ